MAIALQNGKTRVIALSKVFKGFTKLYTEPKTYVRLLTVLKEAVKLYEKARYQRITEVATMRISLKNLRKLSFIKILLIILVLISACGSSPKSGETDTSNQQERLQGILVVWAGHPGDWTDSLVAQYEQNIRAQVEEFTTIYPSVKIVVEIVSSKRKLEQFIEQVRKGFGPDLIMTQADNIPLLIKADALQELSDRLPVDLSHLRPSALSQVRHQDKVYGLPIYLNTQVLCYNKAKVKELPTTLSELLAQARAGYSVGILSGFEEAFWGTQIFGGQLFDSQGRVILEQGRGWSRWMEWLKAVQNRPNVILSDDEPALQQAFIEGRLAYSVCYTGWLPSFREALGKNNLGVTLLPGQANKSAGSLLKANVAIVNRVSNGNQTQLALKLAQFLTNIAQQREMTTNLQLAIPANKNVQINRGLFPLQDVLIEQSKTGFAIPLNQAPKMNALVSYGDILYREVLAGEITPDEAAVKLTQTVNAQFQ